MQDKEPKSLLEVFKFIGIGLVILFLFASSLEKDRSNKKSEMHQVLYGTDMYYNITTEPIEACFTVDEKYMPTREKLNTYFKDEIKVKNKVYSDDNTTIYLDNIKGNDNTFLRFNFTKKDKVKLNKGELVTIENTVEIDGRRMFSNYNIIGEVYDKDNKVMNKFRFDAVSSENEDFMISVNKEELSNMNWPISVKLTLTKVSYEKKR
jgi:hypothetical protein